MIQINVKLPESESKTVAPTDYTVMMTKDGKVTYNGKSARLRDIEGIVRRAVSDDTNKDNATIAIIAEVGVPWQKVNEVMSIASKLKMRAIIATQPKG
tara:strand:- start:769 stop:1062 length:294 start_codon:yes stop_codon:yes gene_type:complete